LYIGIAVALPTLGAKFFLGGFMKKFAFLVLALSLGASTSAALAESVNPTDTDLRLAKSSGPVKMTDEQMDKITAGQQEGLINVDIDVRNNEIVKDVNVAAQIAVVANILTDRTQSVVTFRPGPQN
jgi:hypothetical protein